jgi:hypothetical protein
LAFHVLTMRKIVILKCPRSMFQFECEFLVKVG